MCPRVFGGSLACWAQQYIDGLEEKHKHATQAPTHPTLDAGAATAATATPAVGMSCSSRRGTHPSSSSSKTPPSASSVSSTRSTSSSAAVLSKLSGGLMSIPGFKQHFRVLLEQTPTQRQALSQAPHQPTASPATRRQPLRQQQPQQQVQAPASTSTSTSTSSFSHKVDDHSAAAARRVLWWQQNQPQASAVAASKKGHAVFSKARRPLIGALAKTTQQQLQVDKENMVVIA